MLRLSLQDSQCPAPFSLPPIFFCVIHEEIQHEKCYEAKVLTNPTAPPACRFMSCRFHLVPAAVFPFYQLAGGREWDVQGQEADSQTPCILIGFCCEADLPTFLSGCSTHQQGLQSDTGAFYSLNKDNGKICMFSWPSAGNPAQCTEECSISGTVGCSGLALTVGLSEPGKWSLHLSG